MKKDKKQKKVKKSLAKVLSRYTRFLVHVKPCLKYLIAGVLFGILFGVSSGFGMPVIIDKVLREIFESKEPMPFWNVIGMASLIPAVFIVRGIAGYLSGYFMTFASLELLKRIKQEIFSKIQDYPIAFFDKFTTGDLFTRITNDTTTVQSILLTFSSEIFRQPLQVLGAISFLTYLSYSNGEVAFLLVFVLAVPFCILPVQMVRKNLKKNASLAQGGLSKVAQLFNENLSAAHEVRSFNLQETQKEKFSVLNTGLQRLGLKIAQYELFQQPFMEILSAIMVSITFVYAYMSGMSFSTFAAIGIALYFTVDPIKKVIRMSSDLIKTTPLFDRIGDVLTYESTVPESANPVAIKRLSGEFVFENVNFAYKKKLALRNVNITIPAGTSCALVGESGAGKSSFAKLLMRMYDPQSGAIKVDGVNLKDIAKLDLSANIGSVPQYPVLFNDTVYNNIQLAKPDATKEEIEAASRHAYADMFINGLEAKYNTIVGERGDKISGGQKQRIALARVFLKDAPIVVLDEATSALDVNSERYIQLALDEMMKERTVFIIAHRFSTIRNVQKIIMFKEGEIIDFGTHAELYERCPAYKELYEKQSSEKKSF